MHRTSVGNWYYGSSIQNAIGQVNGVDTQQAQGFEVLRDGKLSAVSLCLSVRAVDPVPLHVEIHEVSSTGEPSAVAATLEAVLNPSDEHVAGAGETTWLRFSVSPPLDLQVGDRRAVVVRSSLQHLTGASRQFLAWPRASVAPPGGSGVDPAIWTYRASDGWRRVTGSSLLFATHFLTD